MSYRQILHVDLDAFFVAVEQARDPSLRGQPVIVAGAAERRGVVSTASYEARRYGVRSGMATATARRLCPDAVWISGDFALYRQASALFMDILRPLTPLVEPLGLDEAFLDLTGCEPIVGSALTAAQVIRRRVRQELGITASAGLASCKVIAKVASDAAKPDGLVWVPPGREGEFLAPRPVRDLPMVGPHGEAVLRRMGIETIGQLALTSPRFLALRFGSSGKVLWRYAQGVDDSPVRPEREPVKSISRETTFPEDIDDRAYLKVVLRRQAEKVGAELRRDARRARTVSLKVRFPNFTTITRQSRLRIPAASDEAIYQAAADLLDRVLAQTNQAVRLIGVGVSHLQNDEIQLSLWDSPFHKWERLSQALDRLRDRHGHAILQTGRTMFALRSAL